MLIIGFGHRARQGKNSAAVATLNACPVNSEVRMYAYADALRAEVKAAIRGVGTQAEFVKRGWFIGNHARLLGCAKVELPDWVIAEEGKPRTLLQWWGTDYRRAQDENYWVKRLVERLDKDQPDVALITDVRFPNEVEAIHAAGGYVVKVIRTSAVDVVVPSHPSEDELETYTGWDYTIRAANMAELRVQAADIYYQITERQ